MVYQNFIKTLFFLLDPESAHELAASLLRLGSPFLSLLRQNLTYRSERLENELAGLSFSGPTGLAAGFDKTAKLYPALSCLGFDFIECGTFTEHRQEGNPLPRLFRLPKEQALINRMGFNNPGAQEAVHTFMKQKKNIPRGISVGKSMITPLDESVADYTYSVKHLSPFADYIALNISSPNTSGLRKLQEKEKNTLLDEIVHAVQNELKEVECSSSDTQTPRSKRRIPLFVKLSPDMSLDDLDNVLDVLLVRGVDGVILSNTSLDQTMLHRGLRQEGGLSGPLIRAKSTTLIRHCFKQAGSKLIIIGVGGIDSGSSALEKILAGASLIQFYTAYVYQGLSLPAQINRHIDKFLQHEGVSLKEAIGMKAL